MCLKKAGWQVCPLQARYLIKYVNDLLDLLPISEPVKNGALECLMLHSGPAQ